MKSDNKIYFTKMCNPEKWDGLDPCFECATPDDANKAEAIMNSMIKQIEELSKSHQDWLLSILPEKDSFVCATGPSCDNDMCCDGRTSYRDGWNDCLSEIKRRAGLEGE